MKKYFLSISAVVLGLLASSCQKNQGTTSPETSAAPVTSTQAVTYSNPVLPGDYADPSVVRVGDDYWATATSSEWAPLYPILHSKNLVDWETVGHVFPNKLPDWAEAHFWAPEITYDKGKFYIYYTAKKKGGNLCVGVASATKATGPYTDLGPLVCQEVGSIDGFPIRDEKGDLYLIWKEDANSVGKPTPLWGQRMNEERTALTGEKFELFRNEKGTWEGGLVEGPALIKRNGYYYMFYAGDACCGRACTYGVGVARAKDIRGPWEKYAGNPIMKKNETWTCPGHGTVVSDGKGRDFFLYHAYSANSTVYPGRQGLLDEITWGTDGWPSFKNGSPALTATAPYNTNAKEELDIQEEFTTSTLAPSWQWFVEQTPKFTVQPGNGGRLLLQATPEKVGSVLSKRTIEADYTATTAVNQKQLGQGVAAGLAAIGDPQNAIGVSVRNGEITLWTVKENKETVHSKVAAPKGDLLQFKLTAAKGDQLQFAWSADGTTWNPLNEGNPLNGDFLPPWDRGVRIGLTAKGPVGSAAVYEWYRLVH
ncbi:family 43 glycosylhydrolase [Rufibacter aurantiacus]|uniref:family 43 glycosylhydrolase n=1 Tax=Rufibacter aurantiacus TaxID=2817374 RepID=UPI001B3067E3|nr:family 43 glycosylhydrolase [Rufibacter aurantiacus]